MIHISDVEYLRDKSFLFTIEVEKDTVGTGDDVPCIGSRRDRCFRDGADELREGPSPP